MNLAPIVLFVYNRPYHTKRTVEALQKNKLANQSRLFIYSDAAKNIDAEKNVKEVRDYIKTIKGFKEITIIERGNNWGLAKSVIAGVTEVVNEYGKVVVLEDDLETTPYFLKFMNDALMFYKDNKKVMSISGYSYPFQLPENYNDDVILFYRTSSWGWSIWKDEWNRVDFNITKEHRIFKDKNLQNRFNLGGEDLYEMLEKQMDGKINSWAIRFALSHALSDCFGLLPVKSLVQNIGFDLSGTHCEVSEEFDVLLDDNFSPKLSEVQLNLKIVKSLQSKFAKSLFQKIKYNIKKRIK
jgi:hypothetical protein